MNPPGGASSVGGEIRLASPVSEEPVLNLLVLDPKPLTRGCLIAALEGADPQTAVTGFATIDEAAPALAGDAPFDAVLISMPAGARQSEHLAELLAPIRAAVPGSAVILLGGSTDPADIAAAFRQGVRGYLTAETRVATTISAIHLVCAGWAVYPPLHPRDLFDHQPGPDRRTSSWTHLLTPRQVEVLELLAKGLPNKSIAFELNMSERTVKAHVKAIMQRVGATNRTQIVARLGNARI